MNLSSRSRSSIQQRTQASQPPQLYCHVMHIIIQIFEMADEDSPTTMNEFN